jgi:hypothetical protein
MGPPPLHDADVFTVAGPHVPQIQPSPALHGAPHPPQLALSVIVSTHCPPHAWSPGRHDAVQAPAEQTSVAPHTVPHPPQLLGSFTVAMQAPLQRDW